MWILLLAGGKGSRMQSTLPKCLHSLEGKTFLRRILETIQGLSSLGSSIERVAIVIPPHHEPLFREEIERTHDVFFLPYHFVYQEIPRGTGHAVQCFFESLSPTQSSPCPVPESMIILQGDMPLITPDDLHRFFQSLTPIESFDMALIAGMREDARGYGRLWIEHPRLRIVEDRDCTDSQRTNLKLCNLGVYWCRPSAIEPWLSRLDTLNDQQELYFTQLMEWIPLSRLHVHVVPASQISHFDGVNTKEELHRIQDAYGHSK